MHNILKLQFLFIACFFFSYPTSSRALEYVEYTDGTIAPASSINNANNQPAPPPPPQQQHQHQPPPAPAAPMMSSRSAASPVQRAPGRIADYDPLSEARPSPYSARQAATTVIYTSDKGAGIIHAMLFLRSWLLNFVFFSS